MTPMKTAALASVFLYGDNDMIIHTYRNGIQDLYIIQNS